VKTAEGWGPIRWQDAEVGKDGIARLEQVKPGAYRLLRVFRPGVGVKVTGLGNWRNAETTVVIVEGKEATLPPLTWSLERDKPAAPTRPKSPVGKAPARKR
jgi:hypothetical protein